MQLTLENSSPRWHPVKKVRVTNSNFKDFISLGKGDEGVKTGEKMFNPSKKSISIIRISREIKFGSDYRERERFSRK